MNTLAGTKEAPRDLSRRSTESEWLDGADASPEELAMMLRDLARFNGAMLGHWPAIDWLRRATKDVRKEKALTLVDVGCGYGDLLRAIRRWARTRDLTIRLIGLDLNRETIRIAQAVTDDADEIGYLVMDVFDFAPAVPIDFVVSSLVTHHMSDDLIVKFLRWMEETARKGWLIYDLQGRAGPHRLRDVVRTRVDRRDHAVPHRGLMP